MRGYKGRLVTRDVWSPEIQGYVVPEKPAVFIYALARMEEMSKSARCRMWSGIKRRPLGSRPDVLRAYARDNFGKYKNHHNLKKY
jgi:hypothetical protein